MSSTAAVIPGVTYHLPKAVEKSFNCIKPSEREATCKRFYSDNTVSQNVPVKSPQFTTASFDAALRSSLRPLLHDKSSAFDSHAEPYPEFLRRTLSFRESDAPPLDALIRQRIQSLPRHLILKDSDSRIAQNSTEEEPVLCDNSELERLCLAGCQYVPRHPLGLGNAGNTCYLNSVLQCLLATGPLLAYISTKHSNPSTCTVARGEATNLQSGLNKSRFCGLCALMRLLKEHSQRSQSNAAANFACSLGGQIVPSYFVGNVRAVCPNFRPYQQEDAHEFLLGLISRMEDCAMAEMGKLSRNVAETNAIRRIFGGVIRSEVTCHSCRKVSTVNEMCFNLSVDITCGHSLQQCLSNYIRSEELCGQNAYKCENCRQLRGAVRRSTIFQGPPILIIQFNRFSRNHKLDSRVEFPSSFNLRPFMTEGKGAPVLYRLYATVNHEGYSCRSGHYVAYTLRNGTWFSHNDSFVNSTSADHVLRQAPYLLFFEAVNPIPNFNTKSTTSPSTSRTPPNHSALVVNDHSIVPTTPRQHTHNHLIVSQIPLPPSTPLPANIQTTGKPSITPFTVRKPPTSFIPRAVHSSDRYRQSYNTVQSPTIEPQTLAIPNTESFSSPTAAVVSAAYTSTSETDCGLVNNVWNAAAASSAVQQLLYRDVYSAGSWEDQSSPSEHNSKQGGPSALDPCPQSARPFTLSRKCIPQKRKHSPSPSNESVTKRSPPSTSSVHDSTDKDMCSPGIHNPNLSSSAELTLTPSGDDSDSSIVWVPFNHVASSRVQKKNGHRRKNKHKMHFKFHLDSQTNQCLDANGDHRHRCHHHRRSHKKRGHKRRRHSSEHHGPSRHDVSEHSRSFHKFHKLHL